MARVTPATTRSRSTGSFALTLLLQLLTFAANAQQDGPQRERGSVMLGAFITNRDSSTRVDSAFGPGTELDLEDDLGLESSITVARLGGYRWFGRRHRLDLSVFDLSREATRQIPKTIDFGDQTFDIDTVVTTQDDLTIGKLDYTFAVLNRDRGYLGIIGGLYVGAVSMTLSATVSTSVSNGTRGRAETKDLTAPLPVIGLRGEYALGDYITLRGALEWFGIDTSAAAGTLSDHYFGADYGFGKRMAVGLAYNKVSMGIRAQESGFRGNVDWGYDGILLYYKVDFGGGR